MIGGLRHLRNYGKKRKNIELLRAINEFLAQQDEVMRTGLKQGEFCEISEVLRMGYME